MDERADVVDRSLSEQVVLLGLVELADDGATPVHSYEVKEACIEYVESRAVDLGELTDREATRSLNRLAGEDVLEEVPPDDGSAVGKGRPAYALGVEAESVLEELEDVDAVATMARRIRADR
jgi:hypothetical protein